MMPTTPDGTPFVRFTVIGTPISQGSKNSIPVTGRNSDIDAIIRYARQFIPHGTPTTMATIADRLAAVTRWPVRKNNRWIINTVDANKDKLQPWRKDITRAAAVAWKKEPYDGPVRVEVDFYFTRPKNHFRTGKFSHELRDKAPKRHGVKPDADKLLRAILDGITGVVITDDSRVYKPVPEKHWLPSRDDVERAEVTVLFTEEE